jgi:hypothetical protein
MNDEKRLEAINTAIWIRENAKTFSDKQIADKAAELSRYGLFSNRQIAKIFGSGVNHSKIKTYTNKTDKTGGSFEPESLETLRQILFTKSMGDFDYQAVKRAIEMGTSQNMIMRLSGVSQSSISRKLKIKESRND